MENRNARFYQAIKENFVIYSSMITPALQIHLEMILVEGVVEVIYLRIDLV